MNSSFFFSKNNRQRPLNIIIKAPTTPKSYTPLPISSRELQSQSQITKTEELVSDYSLTIRKIKRSNNHNLNLSPIQIEVTQKNQVTLTSPLSPEENLFFPIEPKIHTKKTFKVRAATPTPSIFREVKKTNWVFKPDIMGETPLKSRNPRIQSRGKVYKGRCQYPKANISPARFYNLKLTREKLM